MKPQTLGWQVICPSEPTYYIVDYRISISNILLKSYNNTTLFDNNETQKFDNPYHQNLWFFIMYATANSNWGNQKYDARNKGKCIKATMFLFRVNKTAHLSFLKTMLDLLFFDVSITFEFCRIYSAGQKVDLFNWKAM